MRAAGSQRSTPDSGHRGCQEAPRSSSPTQRDSHRKAVGDVVGPLAPLWQRPDRGDAAPDHGEIERSDPEAGDRPPRRLGVMGQRRRQDNGPPEREREVHRHRGGQQHWGAALAPEQERARRTGTLEYVVAPRQGPRRRGKPGEHGARQSGGERIAGQVTIHQEPPYRP
jgi:hypothetical protein